MPRPLLIFSQSNYLIQVVDTDSDTNWQTVQIQISWLLHKPTDLDLHCLHVEANWSGSALFAKTPHKRSHSRMSFFLFLLVLAGLKFTFSHGWFVFHCSFTANYCLLYREVFENASNIINTEQSTLLASHTRRWQNNITIYYDYFQKFVLK